MSPPFASLILSGDAQWMYDGAYAASEGINPNPVVSPEMILTTLRSAPCISVQNVSSYIAGTPVDITDIPSLAPPFARFWTEYYVPEDRCSVGMHWYTLKYAAEGARWTVAGNLMICRDRKVIPCGMLQFDLDDEGHLIRGVRANRDFDSEELGVCLPHVFGVALMHCKNVTLREERDPEKLRKAKIKRGRPGLVKWSVLEIEPMKQVLRAEGKSEATGLKQALHICRGHFKDYRQSGLFGKVKGIFWWDSMARGSSTQGVVSKDYSVKAPAQ